MPEQLPDKDNPSRYRIKLNSNIERYIIKQRHEKVHNRRINIEHKIIPELFR